VGTTNAAKLKVANYLRSRKYDVAYNLHGGTTSSMFVRASGAKHRVGLSHYRYKRFYNHIYTSAADFWHQPKLHSAEQQLALLGFTGVPVDDRPKSKLVVTESAIESLNRKIHGKSQSKDLGTFALLHPSTAFFTKQWPTANFARTAEYLESKGIATVAIASKTEAAVLDELKRGSSVPITTFDDLTLPKITALASQARVFIGNDSGMAHIAAAVGTPSVVIFGSSNRDHWHPWTDAPYEVVFEPFECQPCPGYKCEVFGDAPCIRNITVENVVAAVHEVLGK
jgi:ADP-heptose:LPS heptosyltransferase